MLHIVIIYSFIFFSVLPNRAEVIRPPGGIFEEIIGQNPDKEKVIFSQQGNSDLEEYVDFTPELMTPDKNSNWIKTDAKAQANFVKKKIPPDTKNFNDNFRKKSYLWKNNRMVMTANDYPERTYFRRETTEYPYRQKEPFSAVRTSSTRLNNKMIETVSTENHPERNYNGRQTAESKYRQSYRDSVDTTSPTRVKSTISEPTTTADYPKINYFGRETNESTSRKKDLSWTGKRQKNKMLDAIRTEDYSNGHYNKRQTTESTYRQNYPDSTVKSSLTRIKSKMFEPTKTKDYPERNYLGRETNEATSKKNNLIRTSETSSTRKKIKMFNRTTKEENYGDTDYHEVIPGDYYDYIMPIVNYDEPTDSHEEFNEEIPGIYRNEFSSTTPYFLDTTLKQDVIPNASKKLTSRKSKDRAAGRMGPRGEGKDVDFTDGDELTTQEPEEDDDRRPEVEGHGAEVEGHGAEVEGHGAEVEGHGAEVEGHGAELPGDGANRRKEQGIPPNTDSPPDDQRRFWPLLEDWDSMSGDVRFALLVAGAALGGATSLLLACAVCYWRSPERRVCPVCRGAEPAAAAPELGVLQTWTPS